MKFGFFLFVILAIQPAWAKLPQGYGVSQSGNLVIVKTPWGSSIYVGPVGLDSLSDYSFEVPLSEFRSALAGSSAGASNGAESAKNGNSFPSDDNSLIAEANRLYNKGDFPRALQYVDELCQRNPKNVRAWVMKGSLMHVTGHQDLARQAWQKALELDPENTQIQNILKGAK